MVVLQHSSTRRLLHWRCYFPVVVDSLQLAVPLELVLVLGLLLAVLLVELVAVPVELLDLVVVQLVLALALALVLVNQPMADFLGIEPMMQEMQL